MPKDEGDRRGVIAGAVAAAVVTAALTALYAVEANAVRIVLRVRPDDLLLKPPGTPAAAPAPPSRGTIERAIQADPLNQNIFNTAMMQIGSRRGTLPAPAWLATLGRYGWRSNGALQNLIYYHATRNEIGQALDAADALFRREKLMEQGAAIFSLAETDPTLRTDVVRRLRTRPVWRRPFLLGSGVLTDPAAIEGRYQTLRTLQCSGDALPDQEMTALLPVLVRDGRIADAYSLWSYRRAGIERPLNDPRFSQAAATIDQDNTATPFNWRFLSGDNFDVTTGGLGATGIVINWSGQGVPVFASQQTTGAAGSYRLRIAFDPETAVGTKALGFRMMCPEGRVDFVHAAMPDATHGDWRTVQRVPCAFARFEIFGAPGETRRDVTATLNGMVLQRDGA